MTGEVKCGMYAINYICDELKEGLIYEIDGSKVNTLQDYFDECSRVFDFPIKNESFWNQYSDWIRDFSWLPDDTFGSPITLLFVNYPELLMEDVAEKGTCIEVFFEEVFPFWDHDVIRVASYNKPRSFKVYIMSGDGTKEGAGPTLHPIEYRLALGEETEEAFKKLWFIKGDNTFPEEVEEVIFNMMPGETETVDISLESILLGDMRVELPLDKEQANELKDKKSALLITPAGTALASILESSEDSAVFDLASGISSLPLELRKPIEATGWTYERQD